MGRHAGCEQHGRRGHDGRRGTAAFGQDGAQGPAVQARVLAIGALQDLGGEHLQLLGRGPHARLEGGVVQPVAEAAVELGEPRQRGLVQHHGRVAPGALLRPGAQEVLHREVQALAVLQLLAQAAQQRQVGQPLLEEDLREHAPVVGVVPDHLHRQHLRVAEERRTGRCRARACSRRRSGRSGRRAGRAPPPNGPARSCAIRSVM